MKKLILALVLSVMALSLNAQVFTSRSFLNASAVYATNTIGVTNLIAQGVTGTNVSGTVWTNLSGTKIASGDTNNTTDNLLKTVSLFADRNSSYVPTTYAISTGTNATAQTGPFADNIFIRLKGGSGANSAVSFVFAPVPSGTSDASVEDTTAADLITISVTANGTALVTKLTPLDHSKLIGCAGLRLISITNADTDASSQAIVLECSLNGFAP